jgi:hypothetical protein
MSRCEGEQFHQGLGLAQPPPVWHRLSVDGDGETTEQGDVNLGCQGGLSHRRIFPRSRPNEKGFVSAISTRSPLLDDRVRRHALVALETEIDPELELRGRGL